MQPTIFIKAKKSSTMFCPNVLTIAAGYFCFNMYHHVFFTMKKVAEGNFSFRNKNSSWKQNDTFPVTPLNKTLKFQCSARKRLLNRVHENLFRYSFTPFASN